MVLELRGCSFAVASFELHAGTTFIGLAVCSRVQNRFSKIFWEEVALKTSTCQSITSELNKI